MLSTEPMIVRRLLQWKTYYLNSLKLDVADNSNLHVMERGTGILAINFINKIRSLWQLTDSFYATNLALLLTVIPNDADTPVSQNSNKKPFNKTPTGFKNPDNFTSIDLILTNKENFFSKFCN